MKFTKDIKRIVLILLFMAVLAICVMKFDEIFGFLQKFMSIMSPIVVGGCIAFVINIPMVKIENFLEKRIFKRRPKHIRAISLPLALAFVVAILVVVFTLLIPQISNSIARLIPQIQPFLERANEWLIHQTSNPYIIDLLKYFENSLPQIKESLSGLAKITISGLFAGVFTFATSLISGVINAFLSLIFAVYILIDKEKFGCGIKRVMTAFLPKKACEKTLEILTLAKEIFSKFISGQCVEAVILGVIFFCVLSLLGMPYALLISVVTGVSSIIPIVGAFVGCVVGAFLILIESPSEMLIFIITFIIVQQIEGDIIYPKVVGNSVGLPALLMLLAITVGGGLFGVIGMLVFIPITAVCYQILGGETERRLQEKEEKEKSEITITENIE